MVMVYLDIVKEERGIKMTDKRKKMVKRLVNSRTGISRFNTYAYAKEWAANLANGHMVDVILGDDGLFWVPGCHRDQNLLVEAGYSIA